MEKIKLVGIGAGYFSEFQYEAWARIPEVEVSALCNRDVSKGELLATKYGIANHYTDYLKMLDKEKPDVVDIITPPSTHLAMVEACAQRGIHIICQKPLAMNLEDARKLVKMATDYKVRLMVHENWRFQPWYRRIKQELSSGTIGDIHYAYFRSRMGDGWGSDAYIPRQPYFREYPRFLIFENGIHFIDTFRYLFGEVKDVYAKLKKVNPIIKGEDFATVHFNFGDQMNAVWDANRYNEPNFENVRYTFGEMLIEGNKGSIRLYADGKITSQLLGLPEEEVDYQPSNANFAGDCVYSVQRHFIDNFIKKIPFETNGEDYLKSLEVQEAVYRSSQINQVIPID